MKLTKTLISTLLILSVAVSMLTTAGVYAESPDASMIYESIDLTPYATGKFWIGAEDEQNINNYDTNQKGYKDFTINGDGWYCAAVWPMAATVYNGASIDSVEDYNLRARIHSSSGASYLMPRKTSTVSDKEAIILTGYGSTKSVTMDINKSYDSLSFLVAHSDNLQRAGMKVSIAYSGEEPLEEVSLDALPFSAEEDNLLADLSDKNATPNKSDYHNFGYPHKNLYIYEYSIDTDPTKEIDTITFAGVWDETSTSHNNFGIVALSGGIAAELTGKSYVGVDLSGYTTSKGYIDVSEANASYSKANFIGGGTYPNTYAAIKWPISLREREEGSNFPKQAAEISTEGGTPVLTSEKSGISYTFPAKGTSKDMLMLDDTRSGISYSWGTSKSKTIDISGNYESVSFLAASATASSSMSLDVTATYTDGSTTVMDTIAVPGASDTEQSANDSFVADVSSMKYRDSTDSNGTRTSTFEFAEPIISANSIALYEYTLELDTSKVLKSLTFTEARTSGIGNQGIYIPAITGRRLDYASGNAEGTLSSFKCVDSLTGEDISEAVNGKSFDIEFSVENLSLYEFNLNVFTAAYDRKGNLVTADKQSVTAAPGQSSHVINSDFPEDSFEYAKIMVWDDNLKPYACKVVSIGDGTQSMVDLSEFANGKFYVSADNAEELHISTYTGAEGNALGRFDFPWHNSGVQQKTAAYYPAADANGNDILAEDGLLHSESGIKYIMPQRREGVLNKEALSLNYSYSPDVTVDLEDDIYSKINFVVASSLSDRTKLRVVTTYTDGSRENSEYISIPKHNETTADNYIASLNKISALNDNDFGWDGANYIKLSLYEYTVNANPQKVADKITFEVINPDNLETVPSHGIGNIMVTSVTTQICRNEDAEEFIDSKISGSDYLANEVTAIQRLIDVLEKRGYSTDFSLPAADNTGRKIYIEAEGSDDTGDGSIDNPFATIYKSCEYISANSDYLGDWRVILRGGRYELSQGIALDESILNKFASVTFASYEGETAEITGTKLIDMTKATEVTDTIAARLPQDSAGKVVMVDLTAQNITGVSPYSAARYGAQRPAASQIIIDDVTYTAARWPNSGYAEIAEAINDGSDGSGIAFTAKDATSSNNANWNTAENAMLHGFFQANDYNYDIFTMKSIDSSTGVVTSGSTSYINAEGNTVIKKLDMTNASTYPRRFFVENLLEEIDSPGEWYIDSNNILYIYPVEGASKVSISTLTDAMISVSNINNVHFENLLLNGNVGSAIAFSNADGCEVKGCDIRNITEAAVSFDKCVNSGVQSCDMIYLGRSAVANTESSYRTMTNGGIYVDDCKIESFAMYTRNGSYGAAIRAMNSIGMRISYNEISDSPWAAILMGQPVNAVIEYNDIHHVQKDYGDAGAIYVGQTFISQGNTIRYNFIHDLDPYSSNIESQTVGIYMDDLNCGFTIHGNIIYRAPIGILLGGGKNLTATNNAIIDGGVNKGIYTISTDCRGIEWASGAETAALRASILDDLVTASPAYAKAFPHVTEKYYTDALYIQYPANNNVSNNFYHGKNARIYDTWNNAEYNNTSSGNYKFGTNDTLPFADMTNGDFTINEAAMKAMIPDFEIMDFAKMGLKTER